jgi:carbonic anhydrase
MIKQAAISVSPCLASLKEQMKASECQSLDFLILAHPDEAMISQLKVAFAKRSIAVIALPQIAWDMASAEIEELTDWAVNELRVGGLLLVGHSQGGTPNASIQIYPVQTKQLGSGTNRVTSLLDRMRASQASVKENERHFVGQLKQLGSVPAAKACSVGNGSFVEGLFYRAESGVFCRYDQAEQSFRALVNN